MTRLIKLALLQTVFLFCSLKTITRILYLTYCSNSSQDVNINVLLLWRCMEQIKVSLIPTILIKIFHVKNLIFFFKDPEVYGLISK